MYRLLLFAFIITKFCIAQPAYILIERGSEHFAKKAYADALIEFDKAITAEPKNAKALCFRARCKQALNRKDEALKDYNEAVKNAGKEFSPYFFRAIYFEQNNKADDAISDYTSAINLNANNTDCFVNRGFLYFNKKQNADANKDFDTAIKLGTKNAKVFATKAKIESENNALVSAIGSYTKAIALDANTAQYYFERGEIYFNQKKYKEAIVDFNNAANKNLKEQKLFNYRAQAYINQGKYDEALTDLNTLIVTYKSKDAQVFFNSGYAKFLKNDWGNAAKDYGKAISYKPGYIEAIVERGKCYLLMGKTKYQLAQTDFMQALKLQPTCEEAAYGMGKVFFETSKFEQAAEYLSKSIKMRPDATTYYLRSKCYYKLKKNKECCNDLEKAAEMGNGEAKKDIALVCK